jgi:3-hydroxyisobutyrate dehydrogenase-like beta-hydroxyacid dehydrogenase
MLPRSFPEKSFPPEYVLKDLGHTIDLARLCKVDTKLALVAQDYYRMALEKGLGGRYFPAVIKLIEGG